MEIHNCSICLDDILTTTGSATLSCGHYFHIGCLGRWLMKNDSCPYCRHEANEKERIAEDQEVSESEYEDEEYEEDTDDDYAGPFVWRRLVPGDRVVVEILKPIPDYNEEEHALWVFRTTMEMLENQESIQVTPQVLQVNKNDSVKRMITRLNSLAMLQRDDGYESF